MFVRFVNTQKNTFLLFLTCSVHVWHNALGGACIKITAAKIFAAVNV